MRHEQQRGEGISIHALHEESDLVVLVWVFRALQISIHALHEESDRPAIRARCTPTYFNPRSP